MRIEEAIGDVARVDEMRGNEVKGNLVLSRRWYLAERAAPVARKNVIASLPAESQDYLQRTVMPFSWCAYGPLIDIDLAIIDYVMEGRVDQMREFGRELGRRDVGSVYRAFFLSLPSTSFVLDKLSALGSMYFRESTLAYESVGQGAGRVQIVGRCMPRYMCQYGITGFLEAILEVSKARHPSVEHASCVHEGAAACCWECRWGTRTPPPRRV